MKLQNACAIICTVISVLSLLFGDNVVGRIGEKNMQRLVFAITMGFASYVFLLSTCRTIQFFLERLDKKRAEEKGQGGGYTRIVKKGPRRGDSAEMVILEFI